MQAYPAEAFPGVAREHHIFMYTRLQADRGKLEEVPGARNMAGGSSAVPPSSPTEMPVPTEMPSPTSLGDEAQG